MVTREGWQLACLFLARQSTHFSALREGVYENEGRVKAPQYAVGRLWLCSARTSWPWIGRDVEMEWNVEEICGRSDARNEDRMCSDDVEVEVESTPEDG